MCNKRYTNNELIDELSMCDFHTVGINNRIVNNATICCVKVADNQYRNVCYDQAGHLIEESILKRYGMPPCINKQIPNKIPKIKKGKFIDSAIFLNYYNEHYGHFLTETLARIHPLYFGEYSNNIILKIPKKQKKLKLFEGHGLEDFQIIPLESGMVVGNLLVPDPTMVLRTSICNQHYDTTKKYGSYFDRVNSEIQKCYLSRTDYSRKNKKSRTEMINEYKLEQMLSNDGWNVVHPQNHSISEQISILENSLVVAGIVGSAFHTLLMCKNLPDKLIYLMDASAEYRNRNFILQNSLMDCESLWYSCIDRKTNKFKNVKEIYEFIKIESNL